MITQQTTQFKLCTKDYITIMYPVWPTQTALVAQMAKHLPAMSGDPGSIPRSGRSPGEGNGNPLQYSCLENPMDGGAWWAIVHGVAKNRTGLSNFIHAESILKSRDITLPTKARLVKAMVFPVVMYGCESWTIKKAFWTVALEKKTLESDLDYKEIQPVHPKGNQSWIFIGRTDAEAETPIFWPPDVKSWLIWKVPDAGKDWGREEKGMTEDEMVGWHHRLNGHEFEWTPGVGDGQGGLACCSPWGRKELDTTEWLNWTDEDIEKSSMCLLPSFHYHENLNLCTVHLSQLINECWFTITKVHTSYINYSLVFPNVFFFLFQDPEEDISHLVLMAP